MKVVKAFIDRDTLKRFNPGDNYPSDNPERIDHLVKRGYLKETAAKGSAEKTRPKETAEKTAQPKKTTAKTARSKKKE